MNNEYRSTIEDLRSEKNKINNKKGRKMTNKPLFKFIMFGVILVFTCILNADPAPRSTECEVGTTYVSGHISAPSTTWDTAGSPYIITGHVYVDTSCTLRIMPGVEVLFHRPGDLHSIFVDGYLLAEGTEEDSITFSVDTLIESREPQWYSIIFDNEDDSISILQNCKISYGKWSIICANGQQDIKNNKLYIQPLTGMTLVGVYCWNNSKPVIRNNEFLGCTGIAVALENNTRAKIINNYFSIIGTGISLRHTTSAIVDSNQFRGCYEGIGIFNSSPDCEIKIRWNVFEDISSDAISVTYGAYPEIINNSIINVDDDAITIWNDRTLADIKNNIIQDCGEDSMSGAMAIDPAISEVQISHNIFYENFNDFCGAGYFIPPGVKEILTTNINGDSCDTFFNLFEYNPLFEDTVNYFLSDSSPCINAGDPSLRWDPDSTPPDIGAHYYDTTTWIYEPDYIKPDKFDILCYPNPFNANLQIEIGGVVWAIVQSPLQIEIFDINGRLVFSDRQGCLSLQGKDACLYLWQPSKSLGSGIYLIKATVGNKSITKQIVYLK